MTHLKNDNVAIEKIQRSVIIIVTRYLPYKEGLQRLYLTIFEVKRRRSVLLQTSKIYNGNGVNDHNFILRNVQIHTHIL